MKNPVIESLIKDLNEASLDYDYAHYEKDVGHCFVFEKGDCILYLEIYNDGDIGYIISDDKNKKTIENKDIKYEEVIDVIKKFLEG